MRTLLKIVLPTLMDKVAVSTEHYLNFKLKINWFGMINRIDSVSAEGLATIIFAVP